MLKRGISLISLVIIITIVFILVAIIFLEDDGELFGFAQDSVKDNNISTIQDAINIYCLNYISNLSDKYQRLTIKDAIANLAKIDVSEVDDSFIYELKDNDYTDVLKMTIPKNMGYVVNSKGVVTLNDLEKPEKPEEIEQPIGWDGECDTRWYDVNPNLSEYYIYNANELAGFEKLIKQGVTFQNVTINIMNNIRMNDGVFKYIDGTWYYEISSTNRIVASSLTNEMIKPWVGGYCKGTINGNGHTIEGLYIKNTEIATFVYGCAMIENLVIANSYIISTGADAYTMMAEIINCCGSSKNYIGGMYAGGFGNSGKFYNLYNTSMILATNSSTGGPGGIARDFVRGYIINCYNTGNVGSTNRVGGIAGTAGFNTAYIYNVYNVGNVFGSYNVGYAVGYKFYGSCSYLYGLTTNLGVYGGS